MRGVGRRSLVGAIATIAILGLAAAGALLLGGRDARPSVDPAELLADRPTGTVQLVGLVASAPRFDGSLRLVLTDDAHSARVRVRYAGPAGDVRPGRRVTVTGALRGGVFVAEPDTLLVDCTRRAGHC